MEDSELVDDFDDDENEDVEIDEDVDELLELDDSSSKNSEKFVRTPQLAGSETILVCGATAAIK